MVAQSLTGVGVSCYNYYCNQDGKGMPGGSRKTSTGTHTLAPDANDNQFTAAALRNGQGRIFKPGTVLLVRNNDNNKQILVVIDDVGEGNKRKDVIDLAEGPNLKALDMYDGITYNVGGTFKGGVAGIKGGRNMTITEVAYTDGKDPRALRAVIQKVGKINTKRDAAGNNTGQLKELDGLVTFATDKEGKQVDTEQTVSSATVNVTSAYDESGQDPRTQTRERLGRGFNYDKRKTQAEQDAEYRQNAINELANMKPEEAIMMALMALFFGLLTGKDIGQVFSDLGKETPANRDRVPDAEKRKEYRSTAREIRRNPDNFGYAIPKENYQAYLDTIKALPPGINGASRITLDAGHGLYRKPNGKVCRDCGTCASCKGSPSKQEKESDATFEISKATREVLIKKYGYDEKQVALTRPEVDTILPSQFKARVDVANKIDPEKTGTFVSIHLDDRGGTNRKGSVAWLRPSSTEGSKVLAASLQTKFEKSFKGGIEVKDDRLGLISTGLHGKRDAILLEVDNLADVHNPKDKAWIQSRAEEIAAGIDASERKKGRAPLREIEAARAKPAAEKPATEAAPAPTATPEPTKAPTTSAIRIPTEAEIAALVKDKKEREQADADFVAVNAAIKEKREESKDVAMSRAKAQADELKDGKRSPGSVNPSTDLPQVAMAKTDLKAPTMAV